MSTTPALKLVEDALADGGVTQAQCKGNCQRSTTHTILINQNIPIGTKGRMEKTCTICNTLHIV